MDRSKPTAYEITPDAIVILFYPYKYPVASWFFYLFVLGICSVQFFSFGPQIFFSEPRIAVVIFFATVYSFIRVVSFNRSAKTVLNRRKKTVSMGSWPSPVIPFSAIKGVELLPSLSMKGCVYYALTLHDPSRLAFPIMISASFDPALKLQPEVERELIPAVKRMLCSNRPRPVQQTQE